MTQPLQVLLLDCSPRTGTATSRHLTQLLMPLLSRQCDRPVQITQRALGTTPLAPISAAYAEALLMPPSEATLRYGAALATSDALIQELDAADVLWISTPVHNFTVPAVLKNWIDHVVRKDATFVTNAQGKVGLLRDRPVFVAVTAGGAMFGERAGQPDFFRPYLSAILGVIGLKNVTFLPAPALAGSPSPFDAVAAHAAPYLNAGSLIR